MTYDLSCSFRAWKLADILYALSLTLMDSTPFFHRLFRKEEGQIKKISKYFRMSYEVASKYLELDLMNFFTLLLRFMQFS